MLNHEWIHRGGVFIVALLLLTTSGFAAAAEPGRNVSLRGNFDNCRLRFEKEGKGHVAFIGGSITEMNGYRPMVCKYLQEKFPKTEFTFTDAGIASTCSTTGAFRLERDVLSKGPVDLFFIESAVNDDQDANHARRECIRALEGMIRHTRQHNPHSDIVVTYFVNEGMLEQLQRGQTPRVIAAQEEVVKHYEISTIHLAQEVTDQIKAGELTWQKYGGTHPAPFGNAICAKMIGGMFDAAWKDPPAADVLIPHDDVPKPLDEFSYSHGKFIEPTQAVIEPLWDWKVPDWEKLPGSKRDRFTKDRLLEATKPNTKLQLEFEGTTIGAYVLAGPDAGILEAIVDGDEETRRAIDLHHHFSTGLHYPRTVIFATNLKPGKHRLVLQVSEKTNSKGTAARIMQFTVNASPAE